MTKHHARSRLRAGGLMTDPYWCERHQEHHPVLSLVEICKRKHDQEDQ